MNLLLRFFFNILKNLLFPRPMGILDTSVLNMRVLPTDLDLNFHMNNGRYLTIMDIGRTDFVVRSGLHKLIVKEKLGAVAAAVNITFLKPLGPLSKYQLHSRVIDWDDMWFYIEQQFVQDNMIKTNAIVKVTFLKGNKKLAPIDIISRLPAGKVEKPEAPQYLKELIEGEKHLLHALKLKNKQNDK
jgi:acyl-CoA thioesterase FadM